MDGLGSKWTALGQSGRSKKTKMVLKSKSGRSKGKYCAIWNFVKFCNPRSSKWSSPSLISVRQILFGFAKNSFVFAKSKLGSPTKIWFANSKFAKLFAKSPFPISTDLTAKYSGRSWFSFEWTRVFSLTTVNHCYKNWTKIRRFKMKLKRSSSIKSL